MSDNTHIPQDVWIYRIVVIVLGLTLLTAVIGALYLTSLSTKEWAYNIPDTLVALGSGALGALAGLLAPSPIARRS